MNDKWHQGIGSALCDEHCKNRIFHSSDRGPSDGQPSHSVRASRAEKRSLTPALGTLTSRGQDAYSVWHFLLQLKLVHYRCSAEYIKHREAGVGGINMKVCGSVDVSVHLGHLTCCF